jgi:hypothetical protein
MFFVCFCSIEMMVLVRETIPQIPQSCWFLPEVL